MGNIKETLKNNVSFVYNETLELLIAMGMVASGEKISNVAKDYRIKVHPMADSFYISAKDSISLHTWRELSYFFSRDFLNKGLELGFYESVFSNPEAQAAEEWIEHLALQPAEQIVSGMVYGVYYDNLDVFLQGRRWEDLRKDLHTLQDNVRTTKPVMEQRENRTFLLECLAYPEEAKQRYLMIIRQFYQNAFLPWAERIREVSEGILLRFTALFQSDPEKFLQDYHKDDPIMFSNKTNLHVSFLAQVGNYRYGYGYPVDWVIFGALNDQVFGATAERDKAELFFKAFSDKRRLDLLALLQEKPRYGKEIAESLGITPAAVTYHANFMLFLDLLEMKRSDHRIYYHLKEDRLRELLALANKVMLGE